MTSVSLTRRLLDAELEYLSPEPETLDALDQLLTRHIRRAHAAALVLVPATVLAVAIAFIVLKRDVRIEFSTALITLALAAYAYYKPEMTHLSSDEIVATWMRTEQRELTVSAQAVVARIATSQTAAFDRVLPGIGAVLMFLVALAKLLDWY